MIENLATTDDQRALTDMATKSFAACGGLGMEAIAQRLAGDGLLSALAPEACGGLGLGVRAALPLARAAGRNLLGYPLAEAMLAAAFAAQHGGATIAGVAQGLATIAWGGCAVVSGERARGTVTHAPAAEGARWLAAAAGGGDRPGILFVDLAGEGVEVIPGADLDLDRTYADIVLTDAPLAGLIEHDWQGIADAGMVLRAADMLGAAEASFEDTCVHVSTRRQFGRPLSTQQTVATMLARDHFALTSAVYSIEYAALRIDEHCEDADMARDVACAVTADAAIVAAENAIQLHGALGFTWAMPLHRRLRRIQSAAGIHGARRARAGLAERLLGRWAEAA